MIHLTAQTRIHLAVKPEDFRKQIDGLIAVTRQHLQQDPRSGALYVFINRTRTMIRVLSYEGNGYWVATKRLSKGRFQGWPTVDQPVSEVTAQQLSMLIKGLSAAALANHPKNG